MINLKGEGKGKMPIGVFKHFSKTEAEIQDLRREILVC